MSQPIPDIKAAQQQAREFLDMKFSDFVGGTEKAEALWHVGSPLRTIVKPRYQKFYINDPERFRKNILKRVVHNEFLIQRGEQLGNATVRDVLTDLWCIDYAVHLDRLADIRDLKAREPEKFAALVDERLRGDNTAKPLIELILALDDLAVHGTPIQPEVMRSAIKILQAQFRGWSKGELRYGKRVATEESATAEHYKNRARDIESMCIVDVNSSRIPDFIPMDLRQRVVELDRNDFATRDEIRGQIIELLKQHEPAQAIDLTVAATDAQVGAQFHQDAGDFLMKYIGKLNEIARTLAIPRGRGTGNPG